MSDVFQLEMVLDAKRLKDNTIVCIKRISPKEMVEEFDIGCTDEVDIGKYLSTNEMLRDATNHCVPILDFFLDPNLLDVEYIVMPALRQYNEPEFCFVGEVVDFVSQLLEVGRSRVRPFYLYACYSLTYIEI
jgi:hypothetical protein